MASLAFATEGTPQPQGSTRVFMHAGKPKITTDNSRLKPWRKHVVNAAWRAMDLDHWETTTAPVSVVMTFALPRGKTVKRHCPTVKPDLDKLIRGVLDALTTAGVYADDAQVIRLHVVKVYADRLTPGVHITVTELEER